MKRSGLAFGVFAAIGLIVGCSSGGDAGTTAPSTAPTASPKPSSTTTTPGAASTGTDGASLFAANCAGCHGDKGAGGKRAPVLAGKKISVDVATNLITNGKPPRMPSFKARLSADQITAIAKYVSTL